MNPVHVKSCMRSGIVSPRIEPYPVGPLSRKAPRTRDSFELVVLLDECDFAAVKDVRMRAVEHEAFD
jgi:hypothetical protein